MKGARLAALHLATLAETDRRWILTQLSTPERSAVSKQLREALRLAPDRLSDVLEEVSRSDRSVVKSAATRMPRLHLNDMDADALHPFLDRLPQAAVAAIAARSERRWGARYLEQKEPVARRRCAQLASIAERRVTPAFLDRFEASIAKHFDVAVPQPESRFEQAMREGARTGHAG
ncbi:MAG: hypothetical protein JWR16_1208 [Nevskia sp.]|nr:hypothetical protein [Nevskia sp.]